MSAVVGIDLSSHALDLVKLNEDDNRAEWVRCGLEGKDAWARSLTIRSAVIDGFHPFYEQTGYDWWDDVYLVAIEAPYGRGQAGTSAILNRVVGAVAASLPAHLRAPERCWIVRPDEWKRGLGLKAKPTENDIEEIAPGWSLDAEMSWAYEIGEFQHARDAYCMALWARDTNAKAVAAALSPLPAAEENP